MPHCSHDTLDRVQHSGPRSHATVNGARHDTRPAMGRRRRTRSLGRWNVLLLGSNDRRVLSPILRCAAPKPANVQFHETASEAERAGFRPCRRCKPDQAAPAAVQAAMIATICRVIESADEPPSLASLAARTGLSPYHFHRVFKSVTGVTPRQYAAAHRARRVREQLASTVKTVTEAMYDAGFNSSGRFYESAADTLGMTPSEYRSGGEHNRYGLRSLTARWDRFSSREVSAASARSSWVMIPTRWCTICRTAFRAPPSSVRTASSSRRLPRSSASSSSHRRG